MDQELTLQDANYLNKEDKRTLALFFIGWSFRVLRFCDLCVLRQNHFRPLFPSTLSPFWAMLNTYGILQQVIFRPLGGVVMAHFGDLVGRKNYFRFLFC